MSRGTLIPLVDFDVDAGEDTLLKKPIGHSHWPFSLRFGVAAVALAASTAVASETLYSQPRQPSSIAFVSRTSPGGVTYTNRRIADGFVLADGGRMSLLRFWGGDQTGDSEPDLANVVSFNIRIYADNQGVPGTIVFDDTISRDAANPTAVGGFVGTLEAPMYQFEYVPLEAVALVRGQFYWISIAANLAAFPDTTNEAWVWCSSLAGDGTICQDRFDGNGFLQRGLSSLNAAFELIGDPVCPSDWDSDQDSDSDDIISFFAVWEIGEGDADGDGDADSDDINAFLGAWDEGC